MRGCANNIGVRKHALDGDKLEGGGVMQSRSKLRNVVGFTLLFAGLILGGCAYNRMQLANGKTIFVERVESVPIYISWVYAEEKKEGMIVKGLLRSRSSHAHGTGHVDIAVINPIGKLLGEMSVDYTPKEFVKGRSNESWFEAHLSFLPPDGSRIRVALHHHPDLQQGNNDCGDNQAAKAFEV
jgi:hypothetical protein